MGLNSGEGSSLADLPKGGSRIEEFPNDPNDSMRHERESEAARRGHGLIEKPSNEKDTGCIFESFCQDRAGIPHPFSERNSSASNRVK